MSILIVDDFPIVRQGLRVLLEVDGEMAVVGEAANGREAVEAAQELKPDVILMDVEMPDLGGLEAAHQILRQSPSTRILMVSSYNDAEYVRAASICGAAGYLLKTAAGDELLTAMRAISTGGGYWSDCAA